MSLESASASIVTGTWYPENASLNASAISSREVFSRDPIRSFTPGVFLGLPLSSMRIRFSASTYGSCYNTVIPIHACRAVSTQGRGGVHHKEFSTVTLTGSQIIACELVAAGKDGVRTVSPLDGVELDPAVRSATHREIDQAADAAGSAWPAYRAVPPAARARFLRAIAAEIEDLGDTLIDRGYRETALPSIAASRSSS